MAKRKPKSKNSIKKSTIEAMRNLGTYKPEFEPLVDIYAEMREQYERYTLQLEESGYKCDEFTAAGGTKKSAIAATLEVLRKDILQYSDRLYLNPKSIMDSKKIENKKESPLIKALSKLEI